MENVEELNDLAGTRKALSLTQTEFSREVGVNWRLIQRWETGLASPSPKSQRKLLAAITRLKEEKEKGTGIYSNAE